MDSARRNLRRAGVLKKRSADGDRRSARQGRVVDVKNLAAGDFEAGSGGFFAGGCFERDAGDGGDRRQRFAAKAEGGDREQVVGGAKLRGGVALEGEQRVVAIHALAVVGDADELAAAGFDFDADALAPASSAFSSSSLTTEAGRSTTSPAAIWLATWSERTRMRPMGKGYQDGWRQQGVEVRAEDWPSDF